MQKRLTDGSAARYVTLAAAATTKPNRLRRRSPMHGLDRRTLDPVQVLAQSVSGVSPAGAMAAAPAIVAATAGSATTWSFAVATGLALLIAACIGQFTRRMAAAGSLYSLTAKGLGPNAAFVCGCGLLVGYGVLAMAMLTGAATYLSALLARVGLGGTGAASVVVPAIVLLAGLATVLTVRGIRPAARVMLSVEAASIILMVVVFGILLAREGIQVHFHRLALPPPRLGALAAGVPPALFAFTGFEAAAALGVEARRPFRTIPRAVRWTAGVSGLLLLLAAYTQQVSLAHVPGGLAGQAEPVNTLATTQHLPWLVFLLDAGIALSFFAAALASSTALARVLFSMGREGIVPRALGATHPRHRTPHLAIAVTQPLVAAVPVALLLTGVRANRVLLLLSNTATLGYLVAYLLVCLAAPVFLRRIGELTAAPVVAAAICTPTLIGVLGAFMVAQPSRTLWAIYAVMAAGTLWFAWLRSHRRWQLTGLGVYDETSTVDLLGGPAQDQRG